MEVNNVNISEILKGNGYPKHLMYKTIQRKLLTANSQEFSIGPQLHMVPLKFPFLDTRSQQLEKDLKRDIRKCYNSANILTYLLRGACTPESGCVNRTPPTIPLSSASSPWRKPKPTPGRFQPTCNPLQSVTKL